MTDVTVRASAKFNMHLGVGPVRADGFHPLATVYHAIGLYDDVTVSPASAWEVAVSGDGQIALGEVPTGPDNIAVRAGQLLAAHHGIDTAARIEIHKGIPVAGGLAGGSADAAATLVALDRLWSLQTSDDDLLALAARLGSDVPFALVGGTALGGGRGEIVEPVVDNGAWWWVVVGNETGLSTPSVYRTFDDLVTDAVEPQVPEALLMALDKGDVSLLAEALGNDLQAPALSLRRDLQRTFDDGAAAGAIAVQLSGSGPTVLLLCRDAAHAREVAGDMQERSYTRVWTAPGPVAGAHVITY